MIGTSLERCILDIVDGKVPIDSVDMIFTNKQTLKEAIYVGCNSFCKEYDQILEFARICKEIWNNVKTIETPNSLPFSIPHWYMDLDELIRVQSAMGAYQFLLCIKEKNIK